ncbi:MAG: hypothetical protein ACOYD4_04140 [Solirubrobacterales bacterium]
MSGYDFGPDWVWKLIFWLAGLGFIAAIVGAVALVVWLVRHVRIEW